MYDRHEIGKQGEQIAAEYLKKKGFHIIEKNFYCKRGEIDLIALDKQELVFIEVKTRTNNQYGTPAEAVTEKKKKHIYRAAEYYVCTRKLEQECIRIDVVEVYRGKNKVKINHIKQAFYDQKNE